VEKIQRFRPIAGQISPWSRLVLDETSHSILYFDHCMTSRSLFLFTSLSCLTLGFSSCEMFKMIGPFKPYDAKAVVPQEFLFSHYEPLNRWLDVPVHVQILDVPLLDVFKHPALAGLNYQLVKAPMENPYITMNHMAMTRRQLLYSISHEYQLTMTPVFANDGSMSYIDIRSRR
jgi:hypothetical protein